ncbi:YnfA family protein [Sphingomonas montanisoli]|uniref:YnfA family protein n=1 Tax=Sphingomonas montanisoli TaxID=2606412 RepID=A0A5D9C3Q6_9SPHN|nr:YnfA family protein [Sphingomonas montanisoli]TZG26093.1 YnfA family protein [Sphingomonas montanisoli]
MSGAGFAIFAAAALCEIAGCFTFWMWLRLGKSPLWAVGGTVILCAFAWFLTRIEAASAGRAFAAYGGVYIVCSIAWMAAVERVMPDRWDYLGAAICIVGSAVILLAPRA